MKLIGKIAGLALISVFSISLGSASVSADPVGGTCNGLTPTITGSGTIDGTSKNDIILGSSGNDTINGSSGNDIICGAGGHDTIYGGSGNDQIWGDQAGIDGPNTLDGSDWIDAGSGSDYVYDFWGYSVVFAGSGNDEVYASGEMYGEGGADYLYSNQTALATLNGGTGTDDCSVDLDNVGGFNPLVSCENVINL